MLKKQNIFYYALAILTLLLLETTFRIGFFFAGLDINAYRLDSKRYDKSAFMGFKGTKNYTLNHRTLKDYHNDRGFKTKNFKIKKDDSITRIVTLGGSSVYGYQLQNDQTWPSYLQSELNNKDSEYEVINLGITNYNTFHILGLMNSLVLDMEPDIIILYESWNDIKYFDSKKDSNTIEDTDQAPIYSKSYYLTDLSYFITFCRAVLNKISNEKNFSTRERAGSINSDKQLSNNSHGLSVYKRNINTLAAISRAHKIKLILSTQLSLYKDYNTEKEQGMLIFGRNNYYLDALDRCDSILQDIANEYQNVYFINVKNGIEASPETMLDHIHPTKEGSEKIAKALSDFITKHHSIN